jgi:hypothetical protein
MKAWLSTHPIILFFLFGLKHFSLRNAHQVGPPPCIGPWLVTLHLWPSFKPHEASFFSLHSWWGEDNIPWCYVRHLYIHCKRCRFSCCMWTNPCSFASYLLVFTSTNQHCAFTWCHLHVGRCHHCWPHSSELSFTCCIILGGGWDNDGLNKGRISIEIYTL